MKLPRVSRLDQLFARAVLALVGLILILIAGFTYIPLLTGISIIVVILVLFGYIAFGPMEPNW